MKGALLPNRLIAFEHAIQIGTRESSWTRHYVGSRCADHGRKREPGDGHTRDRGPFSVPRSRVSHLLLPRQPPKLTIPGTTIARRRRCFMFKRSCQIVSGRKIVKICA